MFLGFSVTGASVRPFMHLLQTVSKQGDNLFFEPQHNVLQLRAVNSSRSTHMLVSIDACHLEAYRCVSGNGGTDSTAPNNNNNNNNNNNGLPQEATSSHHEDDGNEFFLMLSTKVLMTTVLRQSQGLCAVHVRYDVSPSSDMTSCDTFQWECVLACGIVKKFALPLAEGRPERAFFPPERFSFDACAAAWVWGALLGWFPALRPRVVVQPLESRLELWIVDEGDASVMMREPHESGKTGDGAETKVVASQEHFLFMQQHELQLGSSGGGERAASVHTPGKQNHDAGDEEEEENKQQHAPRRSTTGALLLPGKIIEVKPLKQICLLAYQLGMMIRVRTGGEGLPVFVEAITVQDAQEAAALISSTKSTTTPTNSKRGGGAGGGSGSGVAAVFPGKGGPCPTLQQNVFGRHSASSDSPFRVAFSMYIAAFDVPQRRFENNEGMMTASRRSINSVTTAAGDDCSVITANASHDVNGPLTALSGVRLSSDGNVLCSKSQQTFPPLTDNTVGGGRTSVRLSTVTDNMNATENNVPAPPRVLVSSSLPQFPTRVSDGPSLVDATPSHGSALLTASPMQGMVVKATPDVAGGAITPQRGGKRTRDVAETTYEKSAQQWVVGCTAGAAASEVQSASFAASTIVSSEDWMQSGHRQKQQGQKGEKEEDMVPPSTQQTPLETRYPLDFNAFMQEIAEEAKEDLENSEEDEDLQRFLESCVSLLVVPPTQTR